MVGNKEAQEWLSQSKEVLDILSNFADKVYKDLPESEKAKIDKEVKSIDLKDISKSLDEITTELNEFRNKYKG